MDLPEGQEEEFPWKHVFGLGLQFNLESLRVHVGGIFLRSALQVVFLGGMPNGEPNAYSKSHSSDPRLQMPSGAAARETIRNEFWQTLLHQVSGFKPGLAVDGEAAPSGDPLWETSNRAGERVQ